MGIASLHPSYGMLAMTVRFALRRQLSFGFLPRVFISR